MTFNQLVEIQNCRSKLFNDFLKQKESLSYNDEKSMSASINIGYNCIEEFYNDHKETYYDEKVLPGPGLNIPGRHVADDGTIRDGEGYICVAANYDYMPKGSILITSLGPAKVYDTGCSYGTIDIYVNW